MRDVMEIRVEHYDRELDRLTERYHGNLDALCVVDAMCSERASFGSHTIVRGEYLDELLDFLAEKYQGNWDALEVVDDMRFWLIEETVEEEVLENGQVGA